MAGDRVSAQTDYYYQTTTGGNSPNLTSTLLSNLLSLISNGAATAGTLAHGAGSNITTNLNTTPGFVLQRLRRRAWEEPYPRLI